MLLWQWTFAVQGMMLSSAHSCSHIILILLFSRMQLHMKHTGHVHHDQMQTHSSTLCSLMYTHISELRVLQQCLYSHADWVDRPQVTVRHSGIHN